MIRQLFSLAALAALFPLSATAQIRYHDIVPDTTLGPGTMAGAVSSFTFYGAVGGNLQLMWSDVPGVGALAHPGIEVLCGAGGLPEKLNNGADISAALGCWYENTLKPLNQAGAGNWLSDADNKYLGFRIKAAGGARYGWVRMSVANSGTVTCTVKDWAYQEALNQSIKAGQTSNTTGISLVNNKEGIHLSLEGRSLRVYHPDAGQRYGLTLLSLQGTVLLQRQIRAEDQVALPQLAAGVYLLHLDSPQGRAYFKLMLP